MSCDKTLPDWIVKKMGEMGEEITNKSINTRNNHSESRSFRDNRYPCIWRCKLAWNISSSIHMQSYDSHLEQGLIGIVKETNQDCQRNN